jgi:hypothetical protein
MPSVEMKKAEQRAFASHSARRANSEQASGDFGRSLRQRLQVRLTQPALQRASADATFCPTATGTLRNLCLSFLLAE